ncbi:MAG: YraN family protein [Marinilabiliales bacterium]|nr:YraN family protein [Marinilabiliales bacterium]
MKEPQEGETARNHGRRGEELAREYLESQGYSILSVNWHYGHRELDIVASMGEEIVMVEVKTRFEDFQEEPWEAVTTGKIRHLVAAADAWLNLHQEDRETRFDVVSVVLMRDGTHHLDHFMGAFIPPVN